MTLPSYTREHCNIQSTSDTGNLKSFVEIALKPS